MTLADFEVHGRPRTKGSLKVITPRGRRPILAEDHAHSAPWRKRIKVAIQTKYPETLQIGHVPITVPIMVSAQFWFEREGPSARHLGWPVVNAGVNANGDLDKLLRNLLDAMKDARLIADDSLVVSITTSKKWTRPDQLPGIDVWVSEAV